MDGSKGIVANKEITVLPIVRKILKIAPFQRKTRVYTRSLSMICTPAELKSIFTRVMRHEHKVDLTHFKRYAPNLRFILNTDAPDFKNVRISGGARLYISRQDAAKGGGFRSEGKSLLVCFGSKDDSFFMTVSRLLAMLPPGEVDVLYLRRHAEQDFRVGVSGFSKTMRRTCRRIDGMVRAIGYKNVGVMGASMGGFAALEAAKELNAEFGISLGGCYPLIDQSYSLSLRPHAFEPFCACSDFARKEASKLYCIYGEEEEFDRDQAIALARLDPSIELRPLAGLRDHNVLTHLSAKRKIQPFFTSVVGALRNPGQELVT